MVCKKIFISVLIFASLVISTGCGVFSAISESALNVVGLNEEGTIISKSAYIRSSYAVVAADLLEVKRGETVEILSETESEKEIWYRVAAHDSESTEGWIEARHVIKGESLDQSKELAEESKELQAQATGQLRAPSNLRLTAGQEEGNILLLLDGQANFDIIDWEYMPKKVGVEKGNSAAEDETKDDKKKPAKVEDQYDVWYMVRLDPSVSPAPVGWIFGRQVDLQVPGDIVYYQTNKRKFVTWQSLDGNRIDDQETPSPDTNVRVSKPGSWVILSRTDEVKAKDGIEPDFDGILVLGFDKYNEEHYTVYSTSRQNLDVWGIVPMRLEGSGDNQSFTVKLRNYKTGDIEEKKFVIFRDAKKRLRVTPPKDIESFTQGEKDD